MEKIPLNKGAKTKRRRKNFRNLKTPRKHIITERERSKLTLDGTRSAIEMLEKKHGSRERKRQPEEPMRAC